MKITSEQTVKKAETTTTHGFYELEYTLSAGEVERVAVSIHSLASNRSQKGNYLGTANLENGYLSYTVPISDDMHKYLTDIAGFLIKIKEEACTSCKCNPE